MKKIISILCAMGMLLLGASFSEAGVSVGINVNVPFPGFTFSSPPPVVVVPGTYVYMVPGISVDIFFYHGWWYRPYEGRWYRGSSYNGPWVYMARPPEALVALPPGYRYWRAGYGPRIPYGQLKRDWGRWERDRHWDRDPGWRSGWEHRGEWGREGWHHEQRGGWQHR
jgi:hypothetical protein